VDGWGAFSKRAQIRDSRGRQAALRKCPATVQAHADAPYHAHRGRTAPHLTRMPRSMAQRHHAQALCRAAHRDQDRGRKIGERSTFAFPYVRPFRLAPPGQYFIKVCKISYIAPA
jgi:hypothetical protein